MASTHRPITLTRHIRALRGGSQPHLMQAGDGYFYVVKFQGNPQGTRVLANELLAAKLAEGLGLPVPTPAVVELPPSLCKKLYFEFSDGRRPIHAGLHFGSRLVMESLKGRSYDCLPGSLLHSVRNPLDLIGIRVFDQWTCNRDVRQSIFWRHSRGKKYNVAFIDNGHCFGGPEGRFGSLNLPQNELREPFTCVVWLRWMERIASFPVQHFERDQVGLIPEEWWEDNLDHVHICRELKMRQALVASEIKNGVIHLSREENRVEMLREGERCA